MYRPEWWDGLAKGRSLLQIALDVHMTKTGSMERTDDEQDNDLALLGHAIENWKPTKAHVSQESSKSHRWSAFDEKVKDLVEQAINELHWSDEVPRTTFTVSIPMSGSPECWEEVFDADTKQEAVDWIREYIGYCDPDGRVCLISEFEKDDWEVEIFTDTIKKAREG